MFQPKKNPQEKNFTPPKLNLYSMVRLERLLGFSRVELRKVAADAGHYYDPFPKREKLRPFQKQFKIPKTRQIDNPTGLLKAIQKNIYSRILKRLALPDNIMGGVKGVTIYKNAQLHLGGKTLAKIDIKNYFPTVTNVQIYAIWRNQLNCSPEIASLLTRLTTFERRLPQGAPTSTILANLVIVTMDHKIRTDARGSGTEYSGWVDDLAFSGDDPRPLINTAIESLAKAGFAVSRKKVKVMGPRSQKILTGTRLGTVPRADPRQLARIRSGINKLRIGAIPILEVDEYVQSLEGKALHVASIDRKKGQCLMQDLRAATLSAREVKG
jgi:RNA-directed DNA polymerase